MAHCVATIDEITELKVGWIAVSQGLDTASHEGRAWIAALRAYGHEQKSERIKSSLRAAKRRDFTPGRPMRVFDRQMALEMSRAGKSIRAIAAALGVGKGTIERLVRVSQKGP